MWRPSRRGLRLLGPKASRWAALCLLSACDLLSPDPPLEEGWPSQVSWPDAGVAQAVVAPPLEGALRIATPHLPRHWHPIYATDPATEEMLGHLYPGLTRLDDEGAPQPALAERWTTEADGFVWVFTLSPDARWSDGSPITADQVVARWLQVINPTLESPHAWRLGAIDGVVPLHRSPRRWSPRRRAPSFPGVEIVDPQVIRIELARPAPELPALLAHPALSPLHPETPKQVDGPPSITAGRHRVETLEDDRMVLTPTTPGVLTLDYTVCHAPAQLTEAIAQGRIDRSGRCPVDPPSTPGPGWLEQGAEVRSLEVMGHLPPSLWQALSQTIDRDVLVTQVTEAQDPALSLDAEDTVSADARSRDDIFGFDPTAARAALAQHPIEHLTLYHDPVEPLPWLAKALARMWHRHLGIVVHVQTGTWPMTEVTRGPMLALKNTNAVSEQPPAQLLTLSERWTGHPLSDPFTEALVERALGEPSADLRSALAAQARARLQGVQRLPLYTRQQWQFIRSTD
ncbi:MAG: ABC transporter substrate-binding protein [Bradymonadia bacterium]